VALFNDRQRLSIQAQAYFCNPEPFLRGKRRYVGAGNIAQ
tara:strand:+ start:71 stop:190 length:120 start_codon:yes stop_codon:yes gene_type:complete